ncbi:MAG: ABC transporter permease [Acidimicrobiia bacterium]
MRLGLLELGRNAGRFAAVSCAIGFIVFLALILAGLSDGLYLGSTGAYRTSEADVFAFSAGSDFDLASSRVDPDLAESLAAQEGVEAVGRLSTLSTTATSAGEDVQLALVGADDVTMPVEVEDGRPPDEDSHQVLIDGQTRRQGIDIGDIISVTDGPDLEVVGVASDAGFGTVTAWIDHDVFDEVVTEVRPELAGLAGTSQTLGVVLADASDVSPEVDGLVVATQQEAIDALPAASQQKTTLNGIVYTTFAVAAIVVGLFFALVTLEKRNQFAVLKAIGMPNRTLVAAVFTQAVVTSIIGFVIGYGLLRLAELFIPPSVPALFLVDTAATVAVITLFMGAIGAVFSFRRIIRIDPASALGGAL